MTVNKSKYIQATAMDDFPKPGVSSSLTSRSKGNLKRRTRKQATYDSIKFQLSSHTAAQKRETVNIGGEFFTLPNSDGQFPQVEPIKSKIWKGVSGRNDRDYLRDSTYGGIMEDLEAFKEARTSTIKREMEDIVSESNDGDRALGQ